MYTDSINIKVVEKKQIYFIDQYWWNQTNSKTFLKLYDNPNGTGSVGNGGYGTLMSDVDDTFYLTVGKVSSIEIDIHGATHGQFFRVKDDLTTYNTAKTEIFSLDNFENYNAAVLETSPKWDNSENGNQKAKVTFENYDENYHRQLHIVGLGSEENAWHHTVDNKFNYDASTKTYSLENVNLEYHDEFLFKEVHSHDQESPFNKLIKFNHVKDKILNTDIALTSSDATNDNFKVGHAAAGVYDITINAEGKINFTKVGENFDLEIRGRILGDENRWSNNPILPTSRNDNIFFFNDIKLQENDRFKVFASDYDDFEYNFKKVTEKPNYFVAKDSSDKPDILLTDFDGVFDITVDIKADSVIITEVSKEHVCREFTTKVTQATCTTDGYTTYTCKSCGDSHTEDIVKAGGHNYTEKLVQPTCTEDGYTLHTCTSCGDSYKTDTVSKKGHNYEKTEHKADCQNEGYTTYKCTVCNYSYNGDKVNKLDCSFNKTAPFACEYNCGHHDTNYIFLKPSGNWKADSAKFAAYFFGNSGEIWIMMTKISDDYYYVKLPNNYDSIIFCRMNATGKTGWDNKWNQTGDLKASGNQGKCYQVKEGTWDKGGGTWNATWQD